MNEIIELLKQSITDSVLVSGEKKEIKALINEKDLSPQDLNVLRSEIFKIAHTHSETVSPDNLIDWINTANKLTLGIKKEIEPTARVYFSPGTQCRDAIVYQIKNAKQSLRICVYTISDDEITNEIIAASKRGIDIKIISDDEKSYDKGSDIKRMANIGIPTKIDGVRGHMHHKFCIIDKETVISGSYNWTRSAADRNYENILIGANPKITKEFLSEFNKIWKEIQPIS